MDPDYVFLFGLDHATINLQVFLGGVVTLLDSWTVGLSPGTAIAGGTSSPCCGAIP